MMKVSATTILITLIAGSSAWASPSKEQAAIVPYKSASVSSGALLAESRDEDRSNESSENAKTEQEKHDSRIESLLSRIVESGTAIRREATTIRSLINSPPFTPQEPLEIVGPMEVTTKVQSDRAKEDLKVAKDTLMVSTRKCKELIVALEKDIRAVSTTTSRNENVEKYRTDVSTRVLKPLLTRIQPGIEDLDRDVENIEIDSDDKIDKIERIYDAATNVRRDAGKLMRRVERALDRMQKDAGS